MNIMSADIGKPLYAILAEVLEKQPELFDDDLGCALGEYDNEYQQQLLMQILASGLKEREKLFVLNKAAWKSDGFILNVPVRFLLPYLDLAINSVINRRTNTPQNILKRLEFILAMFRLRGKGDEFINKILSLNNKKIRRLYNELEDMIDKKYILPESRVDIGVTKSEEYAQNNITDFYYALLVYITGGEEEIKIYGVRENENED